MYTEFIICYVLLALALVLLVVNVILLAVVIKKLGNQVQRRTDYSQRPTYQPYQKSPQSAAGSIVICPHCGTGYDSRNNVCPRCGTRR